jgi:hypothetical protein
MNKSPDQKTHSGFEKERFEADLAREERIMAGGDLGPDLELSADRTLKDALSRIETPSLPPALRERVLDQTRSSPRSLGWFAMAAAVVLSVVVVLALDPFPRQSHPAEISQDDWTRLALAIETLNRSGEQIAQVTQRGVASRLDLSRFELPRLELQLDPLPAPNSFRRWFQPSVPQKQ